MSKSNLARPPARPALVRTVRSALEDMKAVNVRFFDVRRVTDVADCMVVASGNSDRHVRSIAERVIERVKAQGFRPMGTEGGRDGEWVLVDLSDVIVHVMLPRVREFYALEQLWDVAPQATASETPRRRKPRAAIEKAKASSKSLSKSKSKSKAKSAFKAKRKAPAATSPRRGAPAKAKAQSKAQSNAQSGASKGKTGRSRPLGKSSRSAPRSSR